MALEVYFPQSEVSGWSVRTFPTYALWEPISVDLARHLQSNLSAPGRVYNLVSKSSISSRFAGVMF